MPVLGDTLDNLLAQHPDISVLDLAGTAVAIHMAKEGCEFHPDAARRAVADLSLRTGAVAAALPKGVLQALGHALGEMEISCPARSLPSPVRVA